MSAQQKPAAPMTVAEAGRLGGEAVKAKHGVAHFEVAGRKGGEATKRRHGAAHYERIGKMGGSKGGTTTRERYGPEFYERIGRMGGARVKELIELGRAAKADEGSES
jgi:general stress protein YciG